MNTPSEWAMKEAEAFLLDGDNYPDNCNLSTESLALALDAARRAGWKAGADRCAEECERIARASERDGYSNASEAEYGCALAIRRAVADNYEEAK